MKSLAWLWFHSKGFRLNAAVRVVLGFVRVLLGLLMVWLSKRFIDETIRTGSDSDVMQMALLLMLTVLGAVVFRQIYIYITTVVTNRFACKLRLQIFTRLFDRPLYEDDEIHSGDITSRLSKDIEMVSEVSMETFPQMAVTTLQLIGAFLLMRWFDARLAWVLFLLTPVTVIFGKLISHKLKHMTLEIRKSESCIQTQVQEGAEYNAVLRSLGSESWVTNRLDEEQNRLKSGVNRRARFTMATRFLFGCTLGLGYLAAFIWGGIGLRNGLITFGVMTSFLQLVGQIQYPIFSLLNMGPKVVHAVASVERLEELLDKRSENNLAQSESLNEGERGLLGIRFEKVSFGYAGRNREILKNFTHDFRPGSKTAIMGETGNGKTTLFRLMLGFIKPDLGRILIYSENPGDSDFVGEVKSLSINDRKNFVFVPQGNSLLSGTIRFNLQLAKPSATEDEMWKALQMSCADFVSDLPLGLDTELSERGGGLSEGQLQRLAIARGLLRPGKILLFDEISSALDEDTERELFRRLFAAKPDRTMIFVTHRGAVCEMCDDVIRI